MTGESEILTLLYNLRYNLRHSEVAVIELLQYYMSERYTNANYSAYILYLYYIDSITNNECDLFNQFVHCDPLSDLLKH